MNFYRELRFLRKWVVINSRSIFVPSCFFVENHVTGIRQSVHIIVFAYIDWVKPLVDVASSDIDLCFSLFFDETKVFLNVRISPQHKTRSLNSFDLLKSRLTRILHFKASKLNVASFSKDILVKYRNPI